jgi:hypothetical protein
MCVILTCEPNVRPDYDLIETCFYNNPDGAGIMWCEGGRVEISKGFTTARTLSDAIASVPADSPLVVHMRIATSGGIDVGTCHPFPICDQLDALHAANVECTAALAHNGVISNMPTDEKLGISDTVYYVQNIVDKLYKGKVSKRMKNRIKETAPGNRFAIMTGDGDVVRLGSGWETVSKGIQASNSSWRWSALDTGYDYGFDWFSYDDDYAEAIEVAIDMCCGECPNRESCAMYGPCCDEIADGFDDLVYSIKADMDYTDLLDREYEESVA